MTEILDFTGEPPGRRLGPSTVARAAICAEALGDGRVLAVGGQTSGEVSTGLVELITPTPNVTGGVLGMAPVTPRHLHTCTRLPDGSVLVTGGLDSSVDARMAPGALVFMPVPRD